MTTAKPLPVPALFDDSDELPRTLHPRGWPRPTGYANGMSAKGRIIVTGGMIGCDVMENVVDGFVPQVRLALLNIRAVLAEGGDGCGRGQGSVRAQGAGRDRSHCGGAVGSRVPGAAQHPKRVHARLRRDMVARWQTRDRLNHRLWKGPGSAAHRSASAPRCTASGTCTQAIRPAWPAARSRSPGRRRSAPGSKGSSRYTASTPCRPGSW
jgi:hypothetical protein